MKSTVEKYFNTLLKFRFRNLNGKDRAKQRKENSYSSYDYYPEDEKIIEEYTAFIMENFLDENNKPSTNKNYYFEDKERMEIAFILKNCFILKYEEVYDEIQCEDLRWRNNPILNSPIYTTEKVLKGYKNVSLSLNVIEKINSLIDKEKGFEYKTILNNLENKYKCNDNYSVSTAQNMSYESICNYLQILASLESDIFMLEKQHSSLVDMYICTSVEAKETNKYTIKLNQNYDSDVYLSASLDDGGSTHYIEECIKESNERLNSILKEIEIIKVELENVVKTKNELYSVGIVYGKYRNLVAISTFCEYFLTGRCNALSGSDGAYNLYEQELRSNMIIGKLDEAVNSMNKIKENQYYLYAQLENANEILNQINYNTKINNELLLENNAALKDVTKGLNGISDSINNASFATTCAISKCSEDIVNAAKIKIII